MQRHIFFLTFLLSFGAQKFFAQNTPNIVPNHSFEQYSTPPIGWFYKGSDFTKLMKFWSSPTISSPDAYGQGVRVPSHWKRNGFGNAKAKDGESYIGLTLFGCDNGKPHCREYVQARLIEKLVVGQEYYFEFYVMKKENSLEINNISLGFSTEKISEKNEDCLNVEFLIENKKIVESNQRGWTKVAGNFKAESASNFMLLGNFHTDKQTVSKRSSNSLNYAYYYFDKVLIKKIPPILEVPEEESELTDLLIEEGKVVQINNLYFDFDKADLHPRSFINLNKLVKILEENPNMHIRINGHTDSIGKENYNLYLARSRAKEVISYLVNKGIDPIRLSYKTYGSTHPIASNETAEGRAKNRRVDFIILSN